MKFLPKHFAENGKEKLFLNDPLFCKCQNEYYPYNPNSIRFCGLILFSLQHICLLYLLIRKFFFKNIYRWNLKNDSNGKNKTAKVTFKQISVTCR